MGDAVPVIPRRTVRASGRRYQSGPPSWAAIAANIGRILVAAVIGWLTCRALGAPTGPIYAVIVPVMAMRPDPFVSLSVSLTRIVGVLAGVTIGIAALQLFPPTLPTLVAVLLVGLVIGSVRRGEPLNAQVALSALLVFAAAGGDPQAYAWQRLWETAVGAVVTVVVAVLLVPPNPVRAAEDELRALAEGFADVLHRITRTDRTTSATLITDAADLSTRADTLRDELHRATRTGRWAPSHLRHREAIAAVRPRGELAGSLGHQLTGLAITVDDVVSRPVYDDRWPVVREQADAVVTPLADAVRDALLGAPFADRLATSGQALLAFRETQPDPVAVLLRNPLRRIHDQVAAHGSIPALDLH